MVAAATSTHTSQVNGVKEPVEVRIVKMPLRVAIQTVASRAGISKRAAKRHRS